MGYRFLLLACIIALNAFFAGAEVALLSVRRSRLRQMVDEGVVGAQAALQLLANPERLLSVVQVGVTLASLGLGWAGESTVFAALLALFGPLITERNAPIFHGISFATGFLFISYAHVVLGEVVPKNLAIDKADRLAVLVAPALLLFYRAVSPFVYVIEHSAAGISRAMGLRGQSVGGAHSAEEIKYIVGASGRHGQLGNFEEHAIERVLELEELATREIMVPRNEIVSVPVDADLDELLAVISDSKFSRLPVYEREKENILGIVYAKDLIEVWHQRRAATGKRRSVPAFQLRRMLREPLVVPETKPVSQLLDEFRTTTTHLAIVVDEFGTVVGLVAMEDVLEQIFGEIEDEHDLKRAPLPAAWDEIELEGSSNIRDLETQFQIEVPANAGFETLAGFLMYRLEAIPCTGQSVEYGDCRFTVLEMARNRIVRVKVERIAPPLPAES